MLVRRFCYAFLILEAACLLQRGAVDFFALRTESGSRQWLLPAGEAGGGSFPEEVFGFRLRLRDGAVEFYRKQESLETAFAGEDAQEAGGDE